MATHRWADSAIGSNFVCIASHTDMNVYNYEVLLPGRYSANMAIGTECERQAAMDSGKMCRCNKGVWKQATRYTQV